MKDLLTIFENGGVIAYPTEAIFGLGCDPDNQSGVEKILEIKQRPVEKGLILLAGDFKQLVPYLAMDKISEQQKHDILSRWPNGITQVLPASSKVKNFVSGQFDTIAVRVTDQVDVVELCEQTGKPIVSTSANISGQEPAATWQEVEEKLGQQVDFVIKGQTLGFTQPSTIIDGFTGDVFRP